MLLELFEFESGTCTLATCLARRSLRNDMKVGCGFCLMTSLMIKLKTQAKLNLLLIRTIKKL